MANNHCNTSSPQATCILFGPQAIQTNQALLDIRTSLQETRGLNFLATAITALPAVWHVIQDALPELRQLPHANLDQLCHFFQGGPAPIITDTANIILTPLTVISHLIEFWKLQHGNSDQPPVSLPLVQDVQGFCVGFLAAIVVACSQTHEDFQILAFRTVCLAVCVGALVDWDEHQRSNPQDRAVSVAVRWKGTAQYDEIEDAIGSQDGAYVSCITGPTSLTVTIPQKYAASFVSTLSDLGISAKGISLRGRFHHQDHTNAVSRVLRLVERDERFQLPFANSLTLPLRSSVDGQRIINGALHRIALESILLKPSQWFQTVQETSSAWEMCNKRVGFITIGSEMPIPPSLIRHHLLPEAPSILNANTNSTEQIPITGTPLTDETNADESGIAVIGMACRYPEADSIDELWEIIVRGRPAVPRTPEDRFKEFDTCRESKEGPLWSNFIRQPDVFDHRFFGISGREAKSMDPQQRLMLQVAYEAVESTGYRGLKDNKLPDDVGCYVGVATDDYDEHVASHPPSAFSGPGTLRAFISGRISHYFGWSGPSLTLDTACSSSALAIHSACRALQARDCSVAIAGGVNTITRPTMSQNLKAASFLSPTGPSKAFDADADGYSRAEGAGAVVLRPLRDAVKNGDFILAVIRGSSVNQGSNSSPITVPDSNSQVSLYRKTLSESLIDPEDVTYVEAHGTGTQVGDPIEFDSIRKVFGGQGRPSQVFVGSIKDNIGHAEAASGVAGLLKTILMIQHRTIPKLASFKLLNPKIPPLGSDQVVIPTQTQGWESATRTALINNYGAAGSNVAIVVQEHILNAPPIENSSTDHRLSGLVSFPILISGQSSDAVGSYVECLKSSLSRSKSILADLAYNLAIKQKRDLEYQLVVPQSSRQDDIFFLESPAANPKVQKLSREPLSVVLCFGGQNGRTASISKDLLDNCIVLRDYLMDCNAVCEELSLPSLFPTIFHRELIHDVVALHCALFSIQYSCAKSWLACGLKVDRLIGHSFGQLTALCVADAVPLLDGLRLVAERARLIQTYCGQENGIMVSIEAPLEEVHRLLHVAERQCIQPFFAEIACYNGPKNHVVAGDEMSIQAVEKALEVMPVRAKLQRLNNTHAFHTRLIDEIVPSFTHVASTFCYQKPTITIEACSLDDRWSDYITPEKIVDHSRMPVYFSEAVGRIEQQLPGRIVWLEAGSGSPIIPMVRRVASASRGHLYHPVFLGGPEPQRNLTKTTCDLWSNGVKVQFWPFHQSQATWYKWVNIPPYQFAKTRHWLDYKPRAPPSTGPTNSKELLELLSHQQNPSRAVFEIFPRNQVYQLCTGGHLVVDHGLCPAGLYIELILRACSFLFKDQASGIPQIEGLTMSSPLVLEPSGRVFLQMSEIHPQIGSWDFSLFSDGNPEASSPTVHSTGRVTISQPNTLSVATRLQSLNRLVSPSRCSDIEASPMSTGFKGPIVYQTLEKIVHYAEYYHGVQKIFASGDEATGQIVLPSSRPDVLRSGVCDLVLLDNLTLMAGIHVNCLSDRKTNEVWICSSIGEVVIGKEFLEKQHKLPSWTVYCTRERSSEKSFVCDVLALDPDSGSLTVALISLEFHTVPIKSLARVLERQNTAVAKPSRVTEPTPVSKHALNGIKRPWVTQHEEQQCKRKRINATVPQSSFDPDYGIPTPVTDISTEASFGSEPTGTSSPGWDQIRGILGEVLEIPLHEITPSSTLAHLGVDSLVATEVTAEMKKRYNATMKAESFQGTATVGSICDQFQGSSTGNQNLDIPNDNSSSQSNTSCETMGQDFQNLHQLNLRDDAEALDGNRETVAFGERDGIQLLADIYYPEKISSSQNPLPVALMIHGGGHIMLSRKDVRPKQTRMLLDAGFLPVSIDYRLCPEVTLQEGPMQDVCDALTWARTTLPSIILKRPDIRVNGEKVVAVGWSTGGHLAMSLGWTPHAMGMRPPEAILAFYCPYDYEDPCWSESNLPFGMQVPDTATSAHDLSESIYDEPITGYNPTIDRCALGGWMAPSDPRSRIPLYMNWKGKTVEVILNGLRRSEVCTGQIPELPVPPLEQIQSVSPLAQIRNGSYKTPTFIIHGMLDDLIPWEQAQRTYDGLVANGVEAGFRLLKDTLHLYDIYRGCEKNRDGMQAIVDGYQFLRSHV
ncbi:hypothetical protein ASPWEDRAFT_148134 [Aspergillus wentii DTO 134E9]|uniref:Uncharacterized protein n=1 Tax=Aspergillus wentii DTO 134E9 TaxID=1073089 RepID=A0A1L9RT28_ASPWE|nr:uncharacterized protein ASPWEDRAFT_148134 [Aspergillus wentii DTO 134E9]OJJ38079.1 hypothetical protein ASPWEDRAFT_148134 [Aspergillus wentii DTO 134E9]